MITVIDLHTMEEIPMPRACVLCLGNFDGVHLGHRVLIDATLRKKEELGDVVSGAWLFQTPPSEFLFQISVPQITTPEEKLQKFASLGLDCAYLADFGELHSLSPAAFVQEVLQNTCHCRYAVCGFNFHFARNGEGNAECLRTLMNGDTYIADCFSLEGEAVSSSRIRALLQSGDVASAARLLGEPHALTSVVIHGKHLGRTVGIPTVNQLFPRRAVLPKNGIYVTETQIGDTVYPSVSNIGVRPSVESTDTVNCETHIIGFDRDVYGETLTVRFLKRIRDEKIFPSLEALTAQIQDDIQTAQAYHKL